MDLISRPGPWRTKPAALPEQVLAVLSAPAQGRVAAKVIPTLEALHEGERNDTLYRYAGRLCGLGVEHAETLEVCLALNERLADPPLDDAEVHELVGNAFKNGDRAKLPYPDAVCALDIKPDDPVRWTVNKFIPAGELSVVFGDGGTLKTTMMLEVAGAVAGGYPAFGRARFRTDEGPVLFVSEEDNREVLRNRLRALVRGHRQDARGVLSKVHFFALAGFRFGEHGWREHVRAKVQSLHAKLVVFDPLAGMFDGDENALKDFGPVLRFLRSLAAESNAGVVLVHHATKARKGQRTLDRLRGHSSLNQGARAIHFLFAHGSSVEVQCVKQSRIPRPLPFALRLGVRARRGSETDWRRARLRCLTVLSDPRKRAAQFVLDQLAQGAEAPSTTDLKEAARGTGIPMPDVSTALRTLVEDGRIRFTPAAHGKKLWEACLPSATGNRKVGQ